MLKPLRSLAAYPAGDFLGRRFGIIAFLALFCIGVACQTAAKDLATFVVGRVFAGLGVGGTSCLGDADPSKETRDVTDETFNDSAHLSSRSRPESHPRWHRLRISMDDHDRLAHCCDCRPADKELQWHFLVATSDRFVFDFLPPY